MNKKESISFLVSNSEIGKEFSEYEINCLIEYMDFKTYQEGTTIMNEASPSDKFFILLSGEITLSHRNLELEKVTPGMYIGESMFSDEGSRFADAISTEPVKGLEIEYFRYEEFVNNNPIISLKFKQFFLNEYHRLIHEVEGISFIDKRKYLGLVAHNEMKESLIQFAKDQKKLLKRFHLVATGTTGSKIYNETGLMLSKKVASGPLGGDQSIGKMISENNILGLIFFRDPLSPHPHHADIEALGRLCDVYQVPMATNPGGAVAILQYLSTEHPDENVIANRVLEKYINKQNKILS